MRLIARHDGNDIEVEVERFGSGYMVRIGGRSIETDFVTCGRFVRSLRMRDGTQYSLVHHRENNIHNVTIGGSLVQVEVFDPLSLKRRRGDDEIGSGGILKALMPGRVVRVMVSKGDSVRKGAGLVIFEAMKMENEIVAPVDGVVDEIFVGAGETVEGGADLVHITSNL